MACYSTLESPLEALYGPDCFETPASSCQTCIVTPTAISGQSRIAFYEPVLVRWHHTDFPDLPAASSSSVASSAARPPASPGEPSTGAWVGIGVGVGIAVLLLTASIIWLCLRRRRHHVRRPRDSADDPVPYYTEPELEANAARIIKPELGGTTAMSSPNSRAKPWVARAARGNCRHQGAVSSEDYYCRQSMESHGCARSWTRRLMMA